MVSTIRNDGEYIPNTVYRLGLECAFCFFWNCNFVALSVKGTTDKLQNVHSTFFELVFCCVFCKMYVSYLATIATNGHIMFIL